MARSTAEEFLSGHYLFARARMPAFAAGARRRLLEPGEALCAAEDRADYLWILARGHLHAAVQAPHGRPITVAILGPGAVVGQGGQVGLRTHQVDVHALTPCEVVGLPGAAMFDYLRATPAASEALRVETIKVAQELLWLRATSAERARHRVCSVLVYLHSKLGSTIPLTRAMIATVAGLTPESVSRALAPLRRSGWLELRRGLVRILDAPALRQYREGASASATRPTSRRRG